MGSILCCSGQSSCIGRRWSLGPKRVPLSSNQSCHLVLGPPDIPAPPQGTEIFFLPVASPRDNEFSPGHQGLEFLLTFILQTRALVHMENKKNDLGEVLYPFYIKQLFSSPGLYHDKGILRVLSFCFSMKAS